MNIGASEIALAIAVVIFGYAAWQTKSFIALGLAVLAVAFLLA